MPTVPSLTTDRLRLRPFTRDDRDDVFAYASVPSVSRFMTFETHATLADAEQFIDRVLAAPETQFDWAVCEVGRPTVVGALQLGLREESTKADVHYAFSPDRWGCGYASEAVRAVVNWAFGRVESIEMVDAPIVAENRRSIRVVEKCGMVFQWEYREFWPKHDRKMRMVVYGIDRAAWLEQPWASAARS